jgi:hypothetical protein
MALRMLTRAAVAAAGPGTRGWNPSVAALAAKRFVAQVCHDGV